MYIWDILIYIIFVLFSCTPEDWSFDNIENGWYNLNHDIDDNFIDATQKICKELQKNHDHVYSAINEIALEKDDDMHVIFKLKRPLDEAGYDLCFVMYIEQKISSMFLIHFSHQKWHMYNFYGSLHVLKQI